jgi:Restriction endonuclease
LSMSPRTVNPLHFEDLEPHRFEDLVRQLIYSFRDWHDLQATGRLGADDGIDIRAFERVRAPGVDADDEDGEPPVIEREWRVQCKRERRIGPAKVEQIVEGLLGSGDAPHGVMLCAACDFSKKSRDRFRELLAAAGVEEFFLWGKAELEDRLFQPVNDHLLWAYFGFSLRVKKRALKTELRARLATKRKLAKTLGAPTEPERGAVFIRGADADEYSHDPHGDEDGSSMRGYFKFEGHVWPDLLGFVTKQHFAFWDRETGEVDYHEAVDLSYPDLHEFGIYDNVRDPDESNARNYWTAKISPEKRGIVKTISVIHYDQVLAVDELGDGVNPGTHLIVDFEGRDSPFRRSRTFVVDREYGDSALRPLDDLKRRRVFPKKLPTVTWEEARDAWQPGE